MAYTENEAATSSTALSDIEKEQLAWTRAHYTKYQFLIPVRDKVRLFTTVYAPKDGGPVPIMMKRTPYGIPPYGIDDYHVSLGPTDLFGKEGFIFVYQDTRGRGMSEGVFQDIPPQNEVPCDATDTYDTIQWLIEYLPHHNIRHNGKVGMWGVSYNGFTAGVSLIGSHEALKAVSPQAPTAEQGNGDDAYHNGCFCLAAEFNFYSTFTPRAGGPAPVLGWPPDFVYGTPDMYEFFLQMGPLSNANTLYFKGANQFWNDILNHPNYDKWWQARSLSGYMNQVRPAVLVVGGWFDAQDLAGPFALFDAIEKTGPRAFNTLVIGPWQHGRWYKDAGDTLGNLSFGMKTGDYYREEVELAFFKQHLKEQGYANLPKALVFETGKNEWRRLYAWPPPGVERSLYFRENGKLSFDAAADSDESDQYTSDPARPVPVMPNFNTNPPFNLYMTEDQRFASKRPDVLVYSTDELEEDITVAGAIEPVLKVSTTGTDSDFVVKLIDVYPNDYPDPDPNPGNVRRGGYQQLVRGEPFRGKFRNNPAAPEKFVPQEKAEIRFRMPAVYHTFRRGHRIMVHIQSSWFPLVDRNPQTCTNIPTAKPTDFVKAVQRVYRGGENGSRIVLNVVYGKASEMTTLKKGVLTIATYYGFAPVCAEKDGVAWGTDISFVKAFAKDHGLRVEFIPVDFKDIWLRPGNDECDMAAAGITPVAQRVKDSVGAVWSNEYFHVQRSLLVREADKWRTIDDFAGKTIVVTTDSTADLDIKARPAKGAKVLRYSNDQQRGVRELNERVIDAFGEGDVSNDYLALQNPGLVVIDRHDLVSSEPGAREIFSFPVREQSGIIGALNTWLAGKTEKDYTNIPELKPA